MGHEAAAKQARPRDEPVPGPVRAASPLSAWYSLGNSERAVAASFRLTVFSLIPRPLRSFQGGGRRPTETEFCKRHHNRYNFNQREEISSSHSLLSS